MMRVERIMPLINSKSDSWVSMWDSNLYDYNDVNILAKKTITVAGQGANWAAMAADRKDKKFIFKPVPCLLNASVK